MSKTPKLIVLSAQYRGKQFDLTADIHTAGRVEDRDFCIKDSTISSHHCDFVRTENSYLVRDNNSTNGTRVNNIPITEQELQNGDIVQIGGVEVLFDNPNKSTETTEHVTHTNIIVTGDLDTATAVARRAQTTIKQPLSSSSAKTQKIMIMIVCGIAVLIVVIFAAIIVFAFK